MTPRSLVTLGAFLGALLIVGSLAVAAWTGL